MTPRNWRKIKDRLAEMDGAELRGRIRQELAKRQDGLFSHVGSNFSEGPRYPNRAGAGKFFFGADSVPEILTLLQQRIPGRTEEIIKQADKICRHRFDLLGYEDLDFGSPIDWH